MEKQAAPDTRWVRYIGAVTVREVSAENWRSIMDEARGDRPEDAVDVRWERRTGHMIPRNVLRWLSDETLAAFMRTDGNFRIDDTDKDVLPEESTVTDTRKS